jgi:hypothetical protein
MTMNKLLFLDRIIFSLTILIIPSLILKIGGWATWSWWIVFLPLLIPLGWMLISSVIAGFLGAMDAIKDIRKERARLDKRHLKRMGKT